MKMNNARYCGGKEQERMLANGWRIIVTDSCRETPEDLFNRCVSMGYKKVKVYYEATRVRGLHSYFAMVKW